MAHRENSKRPIVLIFDEIRRLLGMAGPLLCARGVLARPSDAVFLTFAELDACLGGDDGPGRPELERRALVHARCRCLTVPELVLAGPDWMIDLPDEEITARGMLVPEPAGPAGTSLIGMAASPGRVTGRARVILDPDDDFDAGDVLFARTVDPGWTAILSCAGGIVLDMGGPLSHGAVVARELGIPCVVNVKAGTTNVVDGSTVTVDGSSGSVLLDV
jgi:pyruvate,water dikinase